MKPFPFSPQLIGVAFLMLMVNLWAKSAISATLFFEAESGDITAPFIVESGDGVTYVYQPSASSTPNLGGRAAYNFTLPAAGFANVIATCRAADDAKNSFWANIDGEPIDPQMVWDVSITYGNFYPQPITWRGTKGETTVEAYTNPQIFKLSAGPHTLIIRGREHDTFLDNISITAYPICLSWQDAWNGSIFTKTTNNFVGQINFDDLGAGDTLTSLSIANLGTARPGIDISVLRLWTQPNGGYFNAGVAHCLGTMAVTASGWELALNLPLQQGNALYLTADVTEAAESGRTIQLSLPAHGATFLGNPPLGISDLANVVVQTIRRNIEYTINFIPCARVNAPWGAVDLPLASMVLANVSGVELELTTLQFTVQDLAGTEIDPSLIFQELRLMQRGAEMARISSPFAGGSKFVFFSPISIPNQSTAAFDLVGTIPAHPKVKSFKLGIANNRFCNDGNIATFPVGAGSFPWLTGQINLVEPKLQPAFRIFPNPFTPTAGEMHITYFLENPAQVRAVLRTLHGSKVRSLTDASQATGLHELTWNGTNEEGLPVRSGVYSLELDVIYQDGRKEKLFRKIAVAR